MVDTKSYFAISANGNPLSIRRSGLRQNGTFGPVDDLALSYDGNQLSSVDEKAAPVVSANSYDLKRGSDDFAYDANGALTMDGTRGITSIAYDDKGSPAGIQFANGSATDYGDGLCVYGYGAEAAGHLPHGHAERPGWVWRQLWECKPPLPLRRLHRLSVRRDRAVPQRPGVADTLRRIIFLYL